MATPKRNPLTVTRDSDGGITVHDKASGIVLSVVGTHPLASGPRGLFIEAYAYRGGPVTTQVASIATGEAVTIDAAKPVHHPTFAFYAREDKA